MSKIIGIDLGTTNSAVAISESGEPRILENQEGNRTMPSIVALNKNNERLVGLLAKRQAITNPKNTIASVKRLIGRSFDDAEVQRDKAWLTYEIRKAKNGGVEVQLGDKWHTPEEVSSFILAKIKADAEKKLGTEVTEAVITVPAYFDDAQRQATKNAGEIAGLKVRRIINEPTAAALAYGLNRNKNEKVVVYDFGGGTFDVSVLDMADDTVEVVATGGDTHLGGDDFDNAIQSWIVSEYKSQDGVDLSKDPLALQRIREAAERAKHELSSSPETEINLPYVTSDDSGPRHLLLKLSRAKFDELTADLVKRSITLTKDVVTKAAPEGAGFKIEDIAEVILVGGQSRIPAIQKAVQELFGKEPHQGINPDEVVSLGAAVQGGILQGDVKDILLLDVTPLTLSIETLGGVATPMIEKNTTIPTNKTQTFSTAADNQPSVEVRILQGERPMASDNKTLANFILDGIPPAARGIPQVEVSFDIDANGILNVSAKDQASGKSQSVRIEASTSLSKDEIENLKKDAAEHATEDKKVRELVETRNAAESLAYSAEKALKDAGDKVEENLKKVVEEKITAVHEAAKTDDLEAIKKAQEELNTEMQKIGEQLYKQEEASQASTVESTDAESESTESKEDTGTVQ